MVEPRSPVTCTCACVQEDVLPPARIQASRYNLLSVKAANSGVVVINKPERRFPLRSLPEDLYTLAMLPVRAFKNVLGIAMVLSIKEKEGFVKGILVCDFSDSVRPG